MADIKSPQARSINMSHIKSRDTKPELFIRKELFKRGYRYRIAPNQIPGHPDIWLAKYNLAIFINGCFWHRHNGCKYAYSPKSNVDFWEKKFQKNIARDQQVYAQLDAKDIRFLIIWECSVRSAVKSPDAKRQLIEEIESIIHSERKNYVIP